MTFHITSPLVILLQQSEMLGSLLNIALVSSRIQIINSSIIAVWKSAADTTDRFITGMTQTDNEGLCVLALSDCHLYHDITVGGPGLLLIQFSDPLVHSDWFLTLGLAFPRDGNGHGVFGHLSLAHSNLFRELLT